MTTRRFTLHQASVSDMDNMPQSSHLHHWHLHMRAARLSERTIEERVRAVRKISRDLGADPVTWSHENLTEYLAAQSWTVNSAATNRGHLSAWHLWLARMGHREDNPMLLVPAVKVPRGTPRPIETAALSRLLDTRMHHRTRVMILLGALAGLRVSEIAKFRGEDVDHDSMRVWVTGKGGVTAHIPAHPALLEATRPLARKGLWFTTHVGLGRGRRAVSSKSVSTIISQAMLRAGVHGTAHQLRHWFGSELIEQGADLRTAQTLLRHASVATTQIYTSVSDPARYAAILRLNPFVAEAADTTLAAA